MNPIEHPDAHNPGDPNVLDRMMHECTEGAELGVHFNESIQDGRFAVYEPSKPYPFWVVSADPIAAARMMTRFPNAHQIWFVTQEQKDKLLEEGRGQ